MGREPRKEEVVAEHQLSPVFGAMRWRNIGPHRGGRVSAVAGDPSRPLVFYFGACAGGVFRTEDAGITWLNVSDGYFTSASIGDIAVAPGDPNVIYVATGEAHIRGNVVSGDGVYKSTDAGRTWTHLGLRDTRHIGRLRIHPTNPDLVYVAALGHAFGPNDERGVFRTRDGGRSWEKVLYKDPDTGAIDIAMDVTNPRILYASLWQARRYPHKLESGGPGSALCRSVDGGDTWTDISRQPGLPEGVLGKIGVAVSPARPERVWAVIEAEKGGLYRSDDVGATWKLINESYELRARSFYYNHVFADPKDSETVYILNFNMWKSTNGGKEFVEVPTPHGDNHGLWIDPVNPDRLIEGNDGGAAVSLNGGRTWSSIYNQPTAQFYHVTTDNQFPYRVYGAQQDNWTLAVPSRSTLAGIGPRDLYEVGGAESGYIAVRGDDPNIVYAGSSGGGEGGRITRYDHRHRQRRDVTAWPQRTAGLASRDYTYRFQWTAPIYLSPHDPTVLYSCANRVFRSTNEGASWELVSPDLTRNDPTKLGPSGGPISSDHTGVEVYCTVFALAESPVKRGVLWAGSDDGLIHLSRDNGATWENVTPPADLLPDWALISIVEPSAHDAATLYVAATRYKLDDNRPYLLQTTDYGKTWSLIVDGIGAEDFTRVIREDPVTRGLLFAGTESGVYVSFDGGTAWQRLQLNLPVVPIHDMAIRDGDLVVASHGRAFWVLDDITPLRTRLPAEGPVLFAPKPTVRFRMVGRLFVDKDLILDHPTIVLEAPTGDSYYLVKKPDAGEAPEFADRGTNPPNGAVFRYYLPEASPEGASLVIRDADGQIIRSFKSQPADDDEPVVAAGAGAHRFIWDLRYPGVAKLPGSEGRFGGPVGPLVLPGEYTAELTALGQTIRATFRVEKDPRVEVSHDDLSAQRDLGLRICQALGVLRESVRKSRAAKASVEAWVKRAEGTEHAQAVAEQAQAFRSRVDAIEGELCRPVLKGARPMAFPPKIDDQLAHLLNVADTADAAPTRQTRLLYEETRSRMQELVEQLDRTMVEEARAFENTLHEAGIGPVL
jgi:photosystem II stability/assembly factor-like uncharacterized protein